MEKSKKDGRGETERLTYNVLLYDRKIEKRVGRMKATNLHEFHSNKAESLLFKTLDDLSHELALDPIGLDGNECALSVGHGPGDRQVGGWNSAEYPAYIIIFLKQITPINPV